MAPDTLTPERVEARVDILWNADDQACQRCGRILPDGVAQDAEWYVDSTLVMEDGEPVEYATIFCPSCW